VQGTSREAHPASDLRDWDHVRQEACGCNGYPWVLDGPGDCLRMAWISLGFAQKDTRLRMAPRRNRPNQQRVCQRTVTRSSVSVALAREGSCKRWGSARQWLRRYQPCALVVPAAACESAPGSPSFAFASSYACAQNPVRFSGESAGRPSAPSLSLHSLCLRILASRTRVDPPIGPWYR